ncbi:MAG TPA: 16S rRNA (cytosine(967)-C(5))-methyltransferase RsmB [Firmicutes bacterium]|jgi:16S rRNA (cytosine967-C5)-methyltransferase|nr:16S rRNA (cytosine(967)-C(5))-methyltransferase RsmB [Bacillota bacterium]
MTNTSLKGHQKKPKAQVKVPEARTMALQILLQIEKNEAYANIALDAAFQKWPASKQERAFCTELVYGTVRHQLTLDWIAGIFLNRGNTEDLTPAIRNILRMAFYQLHFIHYQPEAAVVDEAVKLALRFGHSGVSKLVNAVLRSYLRNPEKVVYPSVEAEPAKYLSIRYSHPSWLVERWLNRFGFETTARLCDFNNGPAPVCIRVNTLRCSREELIERLLAEQVVVAQSLLVPEGLTISGFNRIESLPSHRDGWFIVQDESSMIVGHAVAPKPGETIIDLCGAPGGKATHLAQLMHNEGQIISVDLHEQRTRLIQENASRLGVRIIATVAGDALNFRMPADGGAADAVLLDAPCTGTGVIRRRADSRWRRMPRDISELADLQYRLLEQAATLVEQGGRLVYSTCSLEPEENHLLIERFLKQHQEFRPADLSGLLSARLQSSAGADNLGRPEHQGLQGPGFFYLLPWVHNTDGFFICRMERVV